MAHLEEDDLDFMNLEIGGGRVVRFAGTVDVVLRVAEVAAVRHGAARLPVDDSDDDDVSDEDD